MFYKIITLAGVLILLYIIDDCRMKATVAFMMGDNTDDQNSKDRYIRESIRMRLKSIIPKLIMIVYILYIN
jgi:hypothetical protein